MNRSTLFDEIEQFYGRGPFGIDRPWGRRRWTTDVDVAERDDDVVVVADLPGYDRENIDVRVTDGRLTITAERGDEREDASLDGEYDDASEGGERDAADDGALERYLRRERRRESVTRTVDLPSPVAEADATATYRHGVLTVTLPKATPTDGHRIDVA
ncbi:Hsp20/alpha crystallin family protein [Halorubrum sp. AD140]|uniref:Hsp20/alpha crystallin family protein n=1 Tax=Halorubrum sp. AD140 TaxID=3050073 RepID=UPI002ACCAA3D|nr:Hsp20/alpha crystallin family protein [Halorubrum sp. AD140]MDZ5812133.1 Hsp20/alpha crystallin family protein [Halorubrum sp. AD140]